MLLGTSRNGSGKLAYMKLRIDHEQRSGRLWPVLVEAAEENRPLSYKAAAQRLGIHWRPIRYVLGPIQNYCLSEGLPRLTALVYSQATGVPGAGFAGIPGDESDLQEVYDFDWASVANPFSETSQAELERIADELLADPANAPGRWAVTLSRGNLQRVFRQAVLKAYDYKCAVCEIGFHEVLEAAHIIPWASGRRELRADPRNGICLCANHHRLFDSDSLTIGTDFLLQYADWQMIGGGYAASDIAATVAVHHHSIRLPHDYRLHPSQELLALRLQE